MQHSLNAALNMQSTLLGATTAKANIEKVNAEFKDGEPTFHQKEIARMNADPQNGAYRGAEALGLARSSAFLKSAANTQDVNHEKSFAKFRDEFNFDSKLVDKSFVDSACNELGASPFELRDPSYESNITAKYRPAGDVMPLKMGYYDQFVAALKDKWNRVGYKGDAKFVSEFTNKYSLKPNDQVMNLREVTAKP